MNRHATIFIAVSKAVRQHWIMKGIPADKIHCIYDGVKELPAEKTKFIISKKEVNHPFRLVMMGQISETKGQEQIIKALALLPTHLREITTLDIVGDGKYSRPYVEALQDIIQNLDVKKTSVFLAIRRILVKSLEDMIAALCVPEAKDLVV